MILGGELLNLVLYCAQQVGIALGLGAQTIMLVAYLIATRDGVVDGTEAKFLRATRWVLAVSLAIVLVSGAAITVVHGMSGGILTVLAPAFLFKWLLIVIVIFCTLLLHILPESLAQGMLGGTWSALFVVHILAPVTSWVNLFTLYGIWLVGFLLVWYVIVYATKERAAKVITPKAVPPVKHDLVKPVVIEEKKIEEVPVSTPAPVVEAPKLAPTIVLDAAPKFLPIVLPVRDTSAQKIVIPTAGTFQPPVSPIKSPATTTTDTPFMPTVPPLQPIPVGVPQSSPAPTQPQPAPAVAESGVSSTEEQKQASGIGLNIMPKSPDQIK